MKRPFERNRPSAAPRPGIGAEPPGFAARALAAEAFARCLRERRPIEEALLTSSADALPEADLALARAIVTTAFRRLGTIRRAIGARLSGAGLPEAGGFEAAIVIGAAQVLFMSAADHAAVDLSVELVKRDRRSTHLAKLANALLRRIAREKADILAEAEAAPADLPEWLAARWSRAYGAEAMMAIAAEFRRPPQIDLTAIRTTPAALAAATAGRLLPTGSVRLASELPIPELAGFAEGHFQVQDAAAALPARLLAAGPGQRVLDLCAAPGGKTAQLAAAGAAVTAVERSEARTARLRGNLARLALEAEIIVGDAATFLRPGFDAVLLDAPCSATGTIRRHPEIAWIRSLSDVLQLARTQERLLAQAARNLRPGGVLVFATCSLEPEEGERQVETFLANHAEFTILPLRPGEFGLEPAMSAGPGWMRTLPHHLAEFGGVDGFFACRLRRSA